MDPRGGRVHISSRVLESEKCERTEGTDYAICANRLDGVLVWVSARVDMVKQTHALLD